MLKVLVLRIMQVGVLMTVVVQLGGFAQSIHPVFDSIAHFRLHLAALIAIGVILLLLLQSWRAATAGLVTIAASLLMMGTAIGLVSDPESPSLTLLQFNTLFKNPMPEAFVVQARASEADVITLQEVSRSTVRIMDALKTDYPHQLLCKFAGVGGVAVLSRRAPLKQVCVEGKGVVWMRVVVNEREVTVASIHLHWPWPYKQYGQITDISSHLAQLPQPLVIAGDFNAAPWSHAVARIADASRTRVAPGLRLTLKMGPLGMGPWPMLPIDHVLVPSDAMASVQLLPSAGSDHLPLIARVTLP